MSNSPFSQAQAVTMTQFILQSQQAHAEATGNLTILLHAIEIAVKYISAKVGAAGILDLYGADGSTNVQGEDVKKLDVVANDAFITALKRSRKVCVMVSEENAEPIVVEGSDGSYAVAFDPLDGSSNIDANVSIGTIFGVWHRVSAPGEHGVQDVLQPGSKMVAAGYAMYGSATLMVLALESGVHMFTLDRTSGEFVLTKQDVRIPQRGSIYSVNEGNERYWDERVRSYVRSCKERTPPYSSRYIGSMVADISRTVVKGGIFMYPASSTAKAGKLRLLYECAPCAFILERCGGRASTGSQRILDIVPESIHERCPVFMGSADDVDELERALHCAPNV